MPGQVFERQPDGKLAKFTSIGCYPIFYLTADKNACLCAECAREEETDGNPPGAADANWEDPELHCDACGVRIESAYAEDRLRPARPGRSPG